MELSEEDKLRQLYLMIEERKIECNTTHPNVPPFNEFKELLLSLPMELVGRANLHKMRNLNCRSARLHLMEDGAYWMWPSTATKYRPFAFFWIRGLYSGISPKIWEDMNSSACK